MIYHISKSLDDGSQNTAYTEYMTCPKGHFYIMI